MASAHAWLATGVAVFGFGIWAVWHTIDFLASGDYTAALLGLGASVACFRAGSELQQHSLRAWFQKRDRDASTPAASTDSVPQAGR